MNKNIKNVIRKILILIIFSSGINGVFAVENSVSFEPDILTVDISVLENIKIEQKNLPENPGFDLIESEIQNLKKKFCNYISIDLSTEQSKELAPNLCKQIKDIVDNLVLQADLNQIPEIYLYVGNTQSTYNASANIATKIIEKTMMTEKNGVVVERHTDVDKIVKYKLTLGDGLIKTIFWNQNSKELLEAVIAHEIGHMKLNHMQELKENEYEADAQAVNFIEKSNKLNLIKAINLTTLSGHLYSLMLSNMNRLNLNLDELEKIIRIVSNQIVDKYELLGELGLSTTHVKFSYTVNAAVSKAIEQTGENISKNIVDFVNNLFQNLELACAEQDLLFDVDKHEISYKCEELEEKTNKFFSPITHPAPIDRIGFIKSL